MHLKINNKSYEIKLALSFYQRFKGLMGKTNINYGMMFLKCNSIHTFFMKENIDIIGLDNNNEVIYKYENLEKNKIIKINNPLKDTNILELPANASKKIRIGTILIFED